MRRANSSCSVQFSICSSRFLKLGDIRGQFRQIPLEAECYGMADGKYQCKSPKAGEPIVMQCNKSVRLPKSVKLGETVAKKYPNECGIECKVPPNKAQTMPKELADICSLRSDNRFLSIRAVTIIITTAVSGPGGKVYFTDKTLTNEKQNASLKELRNSP